MLVAVNELVDFHAVLKIVKVIIISGFCLKCKLEKAVPCQKTHFGEEHKINV